MYMGRIEDGDKSNVHVVAFSPNATTGLRLMELEHGQLTFKWVYLNTLLCL